MTKLSSLSLLGFKLLFHPGQTQTFPLLGVPENSFAPTDSISKCPLLVSSASCLLASFKYFSPALSFASPLQANSETSTCQYQTIPNSRQREIKPADVGQNYMISKLHVSTSFLFPPNRTASSEARLEATFSFFSCFCFVVDQTQGSLNWRFYQPSNEHCDSKAKEASPCIRNPRQRNS